MRASGTAPRERDGAPRAAVRAAVGAALAAAVVGCVRDPAAAICPEVAAGDLVITEVRGRQSGTDTLGAWVELYNATARTIDLEGTRVLFRKLDGSVSVPALIRRSLPVPPGAYVVLGQFPDDAGRPGHVDYGLGADYQVGWLTAAAIDVQACGETIDRAVYDSLPSQGTYALGAAPPSAAANDQPSAWCTDATMAAGTYPGTPRQANPPCATP